MKRGRPAGGLEIRPVRPRAPPDRETKDPRQRARTRRSSARSTPSAPCRRGADAGRPRRARNIVSRARRENLGDLVGGLGEFPRQIVDAARDVQQILAGELLLRIDRRVAVGLDAEAPLDDRRVVAQERVELVGAPQVERAFGLVRRRRRSACSGGTLSASSAE